MAAALAQGARQLLLGVAELVDQPTVAVRFLERREVLALHVFEQRDLQGLAVRQRVDHDRQLVAAGELSGPPTPFPGDDLIMIRHRRAADGPAAAA